MCAIIQACIHCLHRPSLESMLEDYWRLMPEYQNVKLEDLEPLRILFGFFPTYRQVTIAEHSISLHRIPSSLAMKRPDLMTVHLLGAILTDTYRQGTVGTIFMSSPQQEHPAMRAKLHRLRCNSPMRDTAYCAAC